MLGENLYKATLMFKEKKNHAKDFNNNHIKKKTKNHRFRLFIISIKTSASFLAEFALTNNLI
jgi:hypothetical protein